MFVVAHPLGHVVTLRLFFETVDVVELEEAAFGAEWEQRYGCCRGAA